MEKELLNLMMDKERMKTIGLYSAKKTDDEQIKTAEDYGDFDERLKQKFDKDFIKMLDYNLTDMNDEIITVGVLQAEIKQFFKEELKRITDELIGEEMGWSRTYSGDFEDGYDLKRKQIIDWRNNNLT
jgi:hypothetical protein